MRTELEEETHEGFGEEQKSSSPKIPASMPATASPDHDFWGPLSGQDGVTNSQLASSGKGLEQIRGRGRRGDRRQTEKTGKGRRCRILGAGTGSLGKQRSGSGGGAEETAGDMLGLRSPQRVAARQRVTTSGSHITRAEGSTAGMRHKPTSIPWGPPMRNLQP